MADTEELADEVRRLSERLAQMSANLENETTRAAQVIVLRECQEIRESIDDRIDRRFRTALLLAGVLLVLLGSLGYLGLQSTVPEIVQDSLGATARSELAEMKAEARESISVIREAVAVAQSNPVIVLQTDYGSKAPYMGTLYGVIYSINPAARIQTITSEIEDFDLLHAAWTLWRASRFYPSGTIFVVITNPGGMTSKPVVLLTENGHIYIGHDNGCFDLVVRHYGHKVSYTIASPELSPTEYRDLFGGVDVYGPTAAKLSMGFPLEEIGPSSQEYTYKLPKLRHMVADREVIGTVADIDKFGNATTDITQSELATVGLRIGGELKVSCGKIDLEIPLKATYGHVSRGAPVAIIYEGVLQLAINEGNLAHAWGISRGMEVAVSAE